MATIEYQLIEHDLRECVSLRAHAATTQESADLKAAIWSLLQRRNGLTGKRAA